MANSGDRIWSLRFERRTLDANGALLGPWETVGDPVRAKITFLRGSEPVTAQRLQGVQPAAVNVLACAMTRQITNAWRCVDDRLPDPQFPADYFAIRAVTPSDDRREVNLLVELGADG